MEKQGRGRTTAAYCTEVAACLGYVLPHLPLITSTLLICVFITIIFLEDGYKLLAKLVAYDNFSDVQKKSILRKGHLFPVGRMDQ